MSIILSWLFGWIIGLGAPILIAVIAGYLLLFSPAPLIRQIALNALVVAACWLAMTVVTQSAVMEAVRHERAAVQAAVAAEKKRQAEASDAAVAEADRQRIATETENAQLQKEIDAYEDQLAVVAKSQPDTSCRSNDDDARRLRSILK